MTFYIKQNYLVYRSFILLEQVRIVYALDNLSVYTIFIKPFRYNRLVLFVVPLKQS